MEQATSYDPQTGKAKTTRKTPTAAQRRARAQKTHTAVRFAIQIAFFVLAPGVFSSALNGVKYLMAQVGAVQAIEPTSFVLVLIGVVAYTALFGRFFCGYACAFGAMGDVLFALAAPLRRVLHIPTPQAHPRLLACLQPLKLLILLGVCALCFAGTWDAVASWDPWAVFGKLTSGSGWDGIAKKGLIVLIAIMVLQALFERSFCHFLCPMGALFSLLPILPFSQFNRRRDACGKRCNRCQDSCPIDIHPDQGSFHAGECIACGHCAVGCPLHNVNLVFIPNAADAKSSAAESPASAGSNAPVEQKKPRRQPKPLLKWQGSGTGTVIAKALVLLALCWMLGLMRFAPSPSELLAIALPWG